MEDDDYAPLGSKTYAKRPHVPTSTLNNSPKYDPGGRSTRLWTYGERAFEQIAAHSFKYTSPIDNTRHDCVAVKLFHRNNSPYQRCAIIDVESFITKVIQQRVPMRWHLGSSETPTSNLKLPPKPHSVKSRLYHLPIPRLLFYPGPKLYLRWAYSPLLLIPGSYYPTKPTKRSARVAERMLDPNDALRMHLAYQEQGFGAPHISDC